MAAEEGEHGQQRTEGVQSVPMGGPSRQRLYGAAQSPRLVAPSGLRCLLRLALHLRRCRQRGRHILKTGAQRHKTERAFWRWSKMAKCWYSWLRVVFSISPEVVDPAWAGLYNTRRRSRKTSSGGGGGHLEQK